VRRGEKWSGERGVVWCGVVRNYKNMDGRCNEECTVQYVRKSRTECECGSRMRQIGRVREEK
jgi:hypothetical protein